jgi:hypothetical protein
MFDHLNAKTVWVTIEGDDTGVLQTVMVVETDLQTDMRGPDYDAAKIQSLVEAAQDYMVENSYITRMRITPIRPMSR